jgi:hypothetical protein
MDFAAFVCSLHPVCKNKSFLLGERGPVGNVIEMWGLMFNSGRLKYNPLTYCCIYILGTKYNFLHNFLKSITIGSEKLDDPKK